jgi:hypothetical protein
LDCPIKINFKMIDRITRINTIKERFEAAEKKKDVPRHTVKGWRGNKRLNLPIIQVDGELLMFRIENSRTRREQQAFIRKNNLAIDFFADPESSEVQEAQEAILLEMAKTDSDFIDDLDKKGQDDPAIITYDGYIVNGNRRTSALKDLGVTHIDCVVLPDDTNAKDVYELEQYLQLARDFKKDYHWINELLNIREGKEDQRYKYSDQAMAKRLNISTQELGNRLLRIELVDDFLIWKGLTDQYDYPKLDEAEQIFIELVKAVKNKKFKDDPAKKRRFLHMVFTMIERKPEEGRLYGWVKKLMKSFDEIEAEISTKTEQIHETNDVQGGKVFEPKPYESKKINESSIIDELFESSDESPSVDVFDNSHDAKDNSRVLIDAIEDVEARQEEKSNQEAVYDKATRALREISGLAVTDESTKLLEAKNKLEQIITTCEDLLTKINEKIN